MSFEKEAVGRYAAQLVEDGMTVGLGTGSTAFYFIDEVGERYRRGELPNIKTVSTSVRSEELARDRFLPIYSVDDIDRIDLLVDGADETNPRLDGIKGGGGALLYEKIVAESADQIVWIVTEDKLVETLGAFPLPVEIVQFGSWKLFRKLEEAGMKPTWRKAGEDSLFITDAGNYIIDLHLEEIPNPVEVATMLNNMVGVVDHGLFLNYCNLLLVGKVDGTVDEYRRN